MKRDAICRLRLGRLTKIVAELEAKFEALTKRPCPASLAYSSSTVGGVDAYKCILNLGHEGLHQTDRAIAGIINRYVDLSEMCEGIIKW